MSPLCLARVGPRCVFVLRYSSASCFWKGKVKRWDDTDIIPSALLWLPSLPFPSLPPLFTLVLGQVTQRDQLSQKVQLHASLSEVSVWSSDVCVFWSTVHPTWRTWSKLTVSLAATHPSTCTCTHMHCKFHLKAEWYGSDSDTDAQKCLLESPGLMSTFALIATGWYGQWDGEEDVILLNPAVLVKNSCTAERNSTLKRHNYDYHGLAQLQHARAAWKKWCPN